MEKLVTSSTRSKIMKRIKNKNTKPELILRKALWKNKIRYRVNYNKLPGSPDIVLVNYRIAIFIDGDFWHGYNWSIKKAKIKSNKEYWIKKIERNMARDQRNNILLSQNGWTVIRFWDRQVMNETSVCIRIILNEIKNFSCPFEL